MTDLIKAAKLWSKPSGKTGRTYLTGRWGGCRVLIFENDQEGEGQPTHWLMIGDAEAGQERPQARPERRPQSPTPGDAPANGSARHQGRGDGGAFHDDPLEDIGR